MTEYRKRYVCPFCGKSTIYRMGAGYACKSCSLKFRKPLPKVYRVMRVTRYEAVA